MAASRERTCLNHWCVWAEQAVFYFRVCENWFVCLFVCRIITSSRCPTCGPRCCTAWKFRCWPQLGKGQPPSNPSGRLTFLPLHPTVSTALFTHAGDTLPNSRLPSVKSGSLCQALEFLLIAVAFHKLKMCENTVFFPQWQSINESGSKPSLSLTQFLWSIICHSLQPQLFGLCL